MVMDQPRIGNRRLWGLLRREEWEVNHTRINRLHGEEGFYVRQERR